MNNAKKENMKLKNKVLYFSIALIVIISSINLISADETDVIITGMKGYVFNLTVNMVKADGGELIQTIENNTEASTGVAKMRFSSATQKVSFYIIVRSNGKIMDTKKPVELGNYSTGAYVYIDLFPSQTTSSSSSSTTTANTTTETNTTEDAETNTTEITLSDSADENTAEEAEDSGNSTIIALGEKFTAKVTDIYGKTKNAVKIAIPWVLWSLLGLAVLAGLVFGGWWIIKWNKKKYMANIKTYGDLKTSTDKERLIVKKQNPVKKETAKIKESSSSGRGFEDDLEKAEQKIREAQEEIARIKSRKNRLSEAQARYEEAKRELEDIRDEEEGSEF